MIQTGAKFGNYKIVRQLGAGGMSDVYEALDLTLERHVALKIMPPEFSQDEERIKRFRKEVLAVAALDHPGIVTIFEVNRAEGCDYYSMSLARHGNLKQLIHKGSLNPERSLRILRAVAEALGHAHEQGIVHRDIKPENILFARPDQPMLADFGIVKRLGSDTNITAVGTSVGTPFYMSPEQAQAIKVDPRSDIYSLGVVLFEMLNGAVPYNATTTIGIALQHVNDPVPKLPGGLIVMQPLVERMMAKDPADRFQDCAALTDAIDRLLAELAQNAAAARARPARTTGPPPSHQRSRKATAPPPTKPAKPSSQAKKPRARSSTPTAPPPAKPPKATIPPPAKSPKPTTPPPAKSPERAAPAASFDPATEFDLMAMTPDPEGPGPQTPEGQPPRQAAKPSDKPVDSASESGDGAAPTQAPGDQPTPAPPAADATEAPARPTPATPTERDPTRAPTGRPTPAPSPASAPARPRPPRRRVNTGTPPPAARRAEEWQSREFYLPAGVAWYRRPLTYIIGSALVAIGAVVLLLKMGMPDSAPSPVELITGRGGPGTRVIGADSESPAATEQPTTLTPAQRDPAAPTETEPAEYGPGAEAEPLPTAASSIDRVQEPDTSRSEFLDRLPDQPPTAGADAAATAVEPAPQPAGASLDRASEAEAEPPDEAIATTEPEVAVEPELTAVEPEVTAVELEVADVEPELTAVGPIPAPTDEPAIAVSDAPDPTAARIAGLLEEASRHRAASRLTPPGDNAWESYQRILELDPGNRDARAGIAEIEAALGQLVGGALGANNLDTAKVYLDRLRTIAPTDPDMLQLTSQWEAARTAAIAKRAAKPGQELRDALAAGGDGPLLVTIGGGEFEMGAADGEASEGPVRRVAIAPFALSKHEVTRGQFEAFATATGYRTTAEIGEGCNYWLFGWRSGRDRSWRSPGFEQTDSEPVVCVSRGDAQAYVEWLSAQTGQRYALPSEARWEYAASRGGGYWSDHAEACRRANVSDLTRAAEHGLESDPDNVFGCRDEFVATAPVGSFEPNAAGLADMLGNAGEWTGDCASPDYRGAPVDGSPRVDGDCETGIVRGGSWYERPANVRVTKRFRLAADEAFSHIGFRVARELQN